MNKLVAGIIGVFGLIGSVQAALGPVVNGQVYDDVQMIHWMQDANVFDTLCPAHPVLTTYDTLVPAPNDLAATVCGRGGAMNGDDAEKFILALNTNNYLGVNTWRQPATTQPDATCSSQVPAGGGHPAQGWGENCTGSDLGHLYYVEGGLTVGQSILADPPGILDDYFTNMQSRRGYWSGTEYAPNPSAAWNFITLNGRQGYDTRAGFNYFVWPVRPRQAAAGVSVPTLPVWGLGLMGLLLAGLGWRRLR